MINKEDTELISLFKRLGIAIAIIIVFSVLFITILIRKFYGADTQVIKKIKNEESMYVLIHNNKCKNCSKIQKQLDKNKVTYYKVNIDKDNKYNQVLELLGVSENDIVPPTIIYINKGKFSTSIVEIEDESIINKFIEFNNNN